MHRYGGVLFIRIGVQHCNTRALGGYLRIRERPFCVLHWQLQRVCNRVVLHRRLHWCCNSLCIRVARYRLISGVVVLLHGCIGFRRECIPPTQ